MSTAEEDCVTLGKVGEGDGFVWGACVWDLADNELARLLVDRAPPLPDMSVVDGGVGGRGKAGRDGMATTSVTMRRG